MPLYFAFNIGCLMFWKLSKAHSEKSIQHLQPCLLPWHRNTKQCLAGLWASLRKMLMAQAYFSHFPPTTCPFSSASASTNPPPPALLTHFIQSTSSVTSQPGYCADNIWSNKINTREEALAFNWNSVVAFRVKRQANLGLHSCRTNTIKQPCF